jgi:hypothetical protein
MRSPVPPPAGPTEVKLHSNGVAAAPAALSGGAIPRETSTTGSARGSCSAHGRAPPSGTAAHGSEGGAPRWRIHRGAPLSFCTARRTRSSAGTSSRTSSEPPSSRSATDTISASPTAARAASAPASAGGGGDSEGAKSCHSPRESTPTEPDHPSSSAPSALPRGRRDQRRCPGEPPCGGGVDAAPSSFGRSAGGGVDRLSGDVSAKRSVRAAVSPGGKWRGVARPSTLGRSAGPRRVAPPSPPPHSCRCSPRRGMALTSTKRGVSVATRAVSKGAGAPRTQTPSWKVPHASSHPSPTSSSRTRSDHSTAPRPSSPSAPPSP